MIDQPNQNASLSLFVQRILNTLHLKYMLITYTRLLHKPFHMLAAVAGRSLLNSSGHPFVSTIVPLALISAWLATSEIQVLPRAPS